MEDQDYLYRPPAHNVTWRDLYIQQFLDKHNSLAVILDVRLAHEVKEMYANYMVKETAVFNTIYASVNEDELNAVIASGVAYTGLEGIRASFGSGIEQGVTELLQWIQAEGIDNLYQDWPDEEITGHDPVFDMVKRKLAEGLEPQEIVTQVTEWACREVCEITCRRLWAMSDAQLQAARANDYAFMKDVQISQWEVVIVDDHTRYLNYAFTPNAPEVIQQMVAEAEEAIG